MFHEIYGNYYNVLAKILKEAVRTPVTDRRIREINSRITSNFNEGITGARSIKTLVIEDTINEDFRKDQPDDGIDWKRRFFCRQGSRIA